MPVDELRETPPQRRGFQLPNLPSWVLTVVLSVAMLCFVIFIVPPSPLYKPQEPRDVSKAVQARDEAAKERAGQFLRNLGFEPGGGACRSLRSGSAYCTIRVADSDRTFALFCSWKHPTCIETIYKGY